MRKTQTPVFVETSYGSMEFKTPKAAEEFRRSVCYWDFLTVEQAPNTLHEAVELYKAREIGGIPEVLAVFRERRASAERHEIARQQRYAIARLAPRDSYEYRTHFDQSHPGYLYGW